MIAWLCLDFVYLKVIIEEGIHNFYYVYFSSEKGIVSWSLLSANFLFSKKGGNYGIYIEPPRLKIGDGKTKINDLPFIEIKASTESSSKYKVEDDLLELK